MNAPVASPERPPALVYLFSGVTAMEGEVRQAEQIQAESAAIGREVIIIGDGTRVLDEREVREGLAQVQGDYHLFIGTHGVNDNGTLRLQFAQPGMTAEESEDRAADVAFARIPESVLNNPGTPEYAAAMLEIQEEAANAGWASAGDIFQMLPPGVQSVITTACHGDAVASDTQYLPEGVPVFSVSVSEIPALARDVDRSMQTFRVDMANNPDPIDMHLNYIVNGIDILYANQEMHKVRNTTGGTYVDDIIPTQIAVAQGRSIDLNTPLRDAHPVAISDASVDRVTDIIMRNQQPETYFPTNDAGGPIRGEDGNPSQQAFSRDNIRADVQRMADRLEEGTGRIDKPFMAYNSSEQNIRGQTVRVVLNSQVAAGLVGAEVDRIATEQNIDLAQAYDQVMASAPAAPQRAQEAGAAAAVAPAPVVAPTSSPEEAAPAAAVVAPVAAATPPLPPGIPAHVAEAALAAVNESWQRNNGDGPAVAPSQLAKVETARSGPTAAMG